jgi:reversibly glycosylated polypeptide/UDP-arabinopyranose mutase
MPSGQYFPICGMNMCFKRELAPATYFPLQGEGQPFRRFDDIWFGVIAKKIMDHLRLQVVVGTPYINHSKASDPMVNLVKEAPGIAFHETFWEVIDAIELTGHDPVSCMYNVGSGLLSDPHEYVRSVGDAITKWAALFDHPRA